MIQESNESKADRCEGLPLLIKHFCKRYFLVLEFLNFLEISELSFLLVVSLKKYGKKLGYVLRQLLMIMKMIIVSIISYTKVLC